MVAAARGVSFAELREIARALPGIEIGTAYRTPALRVKGKFLLRLREDGDSVALKIPMVVQEALLKADPRVFFLTDHYVGYPAILLRLSEIRRGQLADLLELAWRAVAPKRLVAAFDAGKR